MIKHFCDICDQQVESSSRRETSASRATWTTSKKIQVEAYFTRTDPRDGSIVRADLCRRCTTEAIREHSA